MSNNTREVVTFANRADMVSKIIACEFEGIIAEHKTDDILRKVLAIGALSSWNMHGFVGNEKIQEHALDTKDAQSIYWAFRGAGFLKALDSLVYHEHSWGWSFHDLDLLEGLIGIVQSKLEDLPEDSKDERAWGALNIFKLFLTPIESLNVVMTSIPCMCISCVRKNVLLTITERGNIRDARKEAIEYLNAHVTAEDIANTYEKI